jgi:hypothetical protein
MMRAFVAATLLSAAIAAPLNAQTVLPPGGPPPPVPPAVIARDSAGLVTMRAVRVSSPMHIDGRLDEAVYQSVPAISDFIQVEPREGAPATEKTEVWILYDADNVYVMFRCWETRPDQIVANEMRRDSGTNYTSSDNVTFMFDTSYDRRTSYVFVVNSIGGRNDGQTSDGAIALDWNGIWDFRAGRFEGGWVVETAIPFKSLRYSPGQEQIWGFNATRLNSWKNEVSFLKRMPASRGHNGIIWANLAAPLVGIETPPASKNLEIKPYAIGSVRTDATTAAERSSDVDGDVGVDAKYGVTRNLTADFTWNTDFAQVEADEQQVNLTRFSLFFPEKREFFLENQAIFSFGGLATAGSSVVVNEAPILFYSRRIGLSGAGAVPITGGGRLTGRAGRFTLGLLNIGSAPDAGTRLPATNFTVVRVKRDVLRRSSLGLLYTGRSVSQDGLGRNDAFGVDGLFAFYDNLAINTFWARTSGAASGGARRNGDSYRGQLDYAGDRYGVQLERLAIDAGFNPGMGFARRTDIAKTYAQARFSPRPRSSRLVRKYSFSGSGTYIENGSGRTDVRLWDGAFATDLHSGDRITANAMHMYEFIPQPFDIARGVTIMPAGYTYQSARVGYAFGPQRPIFGSLALEHGTFYDGQKTTAQVSGARVELTPQFSVEPSVSINRVKLPQGSFTARIVGTRVTYTVSPLMFVSALIQYNSSNASLGTNVRLRWEYRPGSELFVVYNDQRDTALAGFPDPLNRSVVIKINRLIRF